MATIPSPSDIQRQTPRSRMALVQEGEDPSFAAGAKLGQQVSQTAELVGRVMDYRAGVQAEDAMNKLALKDNERYAKLQRLKGADVNNKDLLKEFTDTRDADVLAIAGTLGSAAAGKFQSGADKGKARYGAVVVEHQVKEQENYDAATHATGIETRAQTGSMAFKNEGLLNDTLAAQELSSANRVAVKLGAPTGKPEDIAMRAALVQDDVGKVVLSAIQGALTANDSVQARRIAELYTGKMTQSQRDKAQQIIKPKSDWNSGLTAFKEHEVRIAGGMTPLESNRIAMEGLDKDVFSAFKSIQSTQEAEVKEANTESLGGMLEGLYNAKDKGLYGAEIKSTPEYINMSGPARASFSKQVDIEIDQAKRGGQEKLSESGFPKYLEVLNSPNFVKMTSNQINALRSEIGNTLTNSVLKEHAAIVGGAAKDKIPYALIKDAMSQDILKSKEKSASFTGYITYTYSKFKEDNPGVQLSDDGKQRLIASAYDEMVKPGAGWFGSDKKVPAYEQDKSSMPKEVADALTGATDKEKITFYQTLKERESILLKNGTIKAPYSAQEIGNFFNELNPKKKAKPAVPAQPQSLFDNSREQSDLVKSIPR